MEMKTRFSSDSSDTSTAGRSYAFKLMRVHPLTWIEPFAGNELTLDVLHERVRDAVGPAFRHNSGFRWVDLNQLCTEPMVRITTQHVQKALDKHRRCQVSDRELVAWATMMVINNVYYWQSEDAQVAVCLNALCLDFVPK